MANKTIDQVTPTGTTLGADDYFLIAHKLTPGVYETQKITTATAAATLASTQNLGDTLTEGNTTDGNNISMTTGDVINSATVPSNAIDMNSTNPGFTDGVAITSPNAIATSVADTDNTTSYNVILPDRVFLTRTENPDAGVYGNARISIYKNSGTNVVGISIKDVTNNRSVTEVTKLDSKMYNTTYTGVNTANINKTINHITASEVQNYLVTEAGVAYEYQVSINPKTTGERRGYTVTQDWGTAEDITITNRISRDAINITESGTKENISYSYSGGKLLAYSKTVAVENDTENIRENRDYTKSVGGESRVLNIIEDQSGSSLNILYDDGTTVSSYSLSSKPDSRTEIIATNGTYIIDKTVDTNGMNYKVLGAHTISMEMLKDTYFNISYNTPTSSTYTYLANMTVETKILQGSDYNAENRNLTDNTYRVKVGNVFSQLMLDPANNQDVTCMRVYDNTGKLATTNYELGKVTIQAAGAGDAEIVVDSLAGTYGTIKLTANSKVTTTVDNGIVSNVVEQDASNFTITNTGNINFYGNVLDMSSMIVLIPGLPIYADNAAAITGGLVVDQVYRTSGGDLKIVHP